MGDNIERSDAEAALQARKDLGSDYDDALVASFADRIEHVVQDRVNDEVARRSTRAAPDHFERVAPFVLGMSSLVALIPISIVLGVNDQLVALVIAVLGIAAVNAAHAAAANGRRRD